MPHGDEAKPADPADSVEPAESSYWEKLEKGSSLGADFEPVVDLPPEPAEDLAAKAELAASEENFTADQKLDDLYDELGIRNSPDAAAEEQRQVLRRAYMLGTQSASAPAAEPAPAPAAPRRDTM
jgi:hypothetical protein